MLIIMLVFVNYAHFSKICRNYASTFYLKFGKNTSITMQQTSKWQTHLPYSVTSRNVLKECIIYCLKTVALRSHECDNKQTKKKDFFNLNLPVTLTSGQKTLVA